MPQELSQEDKKELLEKYMVALLNFEQATNILSYVFSYIMVDPNDYICENYPFHLSFDDLRGEIENWTDSCLDLLSKETGININKLREDFEKNKIGINLNYNTSEGVILHKEKKNKEEIKK